MDNIIMHIDVNNAFLSWTAVDLLKNGYTETARAEELELNNYIELSNILQ